MGSYNYTISIGHLGEQLTLNQWVLGSSPRWCTRNSLTQCVGLLFYCCNPECRGSLCTIGDENSRAGGRRLRPKQGAGAGATVAEATSRPRGAGRCGHRNL